MADVMEVKRGIFGASISWNDIINQKEASQSLKKTVNCFMLHISFKSKQKLSDGLKFKDCIPHDLLPSVVYKYAC